MHGAAALRRTPPGAAPAAVRARGAQAAGAGERPPDRVPPAFRAFVAAHAAELRGDALVAAGLEGLVSGRAYVLDDDVRRGRATVVADLAEPGSLPSARFDAVALPELDEAGRANAWAALRPGGVLLTGSRADGEGRVSGRTLVLLYHRVADMERDPYRIAIGARAASPSTSSCSRPATSSSRSRARVSASGGPRVSLTFDDGYVDNLTTALPVLEPRARPRRSSSRRATSAAAPFWWDRLERLAFDGTAERERIEVEVAGRPLLADTRTPAAVARATRRSTGGCARSRRRRSTGSSTGSPSSSAPTRAPHDRRPVTEDELRELAAAPGIEIGAHTVSHPLLTTLPPGGAAPRGRGEPRAAARS